MAEPLPRDSMLATADKKFDEPSPSSLTDRPTEDQERLLNLFDCVGADDPSTSRPGKRLFVRRRAGRSVELAQIVEGNVSYVSVETPDIVEILEADDFDGGVISGVVDGWWRTGRQNCPVTDAVDDDQDEKRAQEIVASAHGMDRDQIQKHQPTTRVEISQKTGKGDVHTIIATKLDLARAMVVAQLQPSINRLVGGSTDGSEDSRSWVDVIRDRGVVSLFGYNRIKDVAMDVSPPGRVRALITVSVLAILSLLLGIVRIQLFGVAGLIQQLMIIGQHIGGAASTIPIGLAAISLLRE